MKVTNITEFIRNSKKVIDWVNKNEIVILHRQRGKDLVLVSLDEWNRLNVKNEDHLHGYKDETEYLLSTKANREHLKKSTEQVKNNDTVSIDLDDIWNE